MKRGLFFLLFFFSLCAVLQAAEQVPADADQGRIMKIICAGALTKEKTGWTCSIEDADEYDRFAELHWSTAMQGHWIERDGEWLVTVTGVCRQGCPLMSYVFINNENGWIKEKEFEGGIHAGCIKAGGFADGLDRAVCVDSAGPFQGFMAQSLVVRSFAGGTESAVELAYSEQGGECYLAHPPDKAEFRNDEVIDLTPGEPGSEIAFTATLELHRLDKCDSTIEDPEKRAVIKGRHILKFMKRGNQVVPDAETKAIIDQSDWTPRLQ
jgi:hypothetical protein